MINRRTLLITAKVLVSATLLYLLTRAVDTQALLIAIRQLDAGSLLLAASLVALQCTLLGWRWLRLVRHLGGVLPAGQALHWTMVGIFFNHALPSSVGGDAMRIWMLHKHSPQPGLALGSVLVERVSGLVVLALIVSAAAAVLFHQGQLARIGRPLLWVGPALLAGTAVALAFGHAMSQLLPAAAAARLQLLGDGFRRIWRNPLALLEALVLGAAASGTGLLAAWVLGLAFGIAAPPHAYLALMGGALLLAVLPVSLGGWGVREAAVVALFGSIGVPGEPVLAMSVVWALLPVLASAPFAVAWWLSYERPARARGTPP